MKNMAVWFDVPVENLERAMTFYSTVFSVEMTKMEGAPKGYAMFPHGHGSCSGGLVVEPESISDKGPLLYFNGGEDLSRPLQKIEAAGGKVLQPKTSIGEHGFMAIFKDTEGNRLALHSEN